MNTARSLRFLLAVAVGLALQLPAVAETSREKVRELLAKATTLADLFALSADLDAAKPILVATVELREPVRDGAEGTVQFLEDGAEVAYLAQDGSVAIYDVASGKRRRAVRIVDRLDVDETIAYVLDTFQRRIAVADRRKIHLQEFPVLEKVRDFTLPKGRTFDPRVSTFCGKATFVAAAGDMLRIVTKKRLQSVQLPGEPASMWGNPRELEVLAWCATTSEEGAGASWKLVRIRDREGWQVEELATLPGSPDSDPQWFWSPDGLATAAVTEDLNLCLSTRDGSELATGTLPADDDAGQPSCEGLTHGGKYILAVTPTGSRSAHTTSDGYEVAHRFELTLPEDAATLTHSSAGDRWLAISLDRKKLYVYGPPSAKAKRY